MQYIKSVMESEGVQELVNKNDQIINDLVNSTITNIISENVAIARDNLDQFVCEGDLLDTYEDISAWANNDINSYMEAVSIVLSDSELTQEAKIEILEEDLSKKQAKRDRILAGSKTGSRDEMKKRGGKIVGAGGKAKKYVMGKYDEMKKKRKANKENSKKAAAAVA